LSAHEIQEIILHQLAKEYTKMVNGKMNTVKCEICNREVESLFIVNHKKRGRIRICEHCLKKEDKNLGAQKGCCCC
jgi:hypothetical protein